MLRVGSVPYLVGWPLDAALEHEPGIEFQRAAPADLVTALRAGTIDVALVSSIELFRRPGYTYLDELAVAGEATVSSVQVFLRRPVEQVRRVALDPKSRTAATLTQIVWPTTPRPTFLEVAPGEDPREAAADAWLRIGDAALRELWVPEAPPVFNPSAAWREQTGLPFAFALWIARPGIDLRPHASAFLRARTKGVTRIAEIAREGSESGGLPYFELRHYLEEECSYDLGDRLSPSLFAFRDAAAKLGLADGTLVPTAVPVSPADLVR